jgi:hypothetical protein
MVHRGEYYSAPVSCTIGATNGVTSGRVESGQLDVRHDDLGRGGRLPRFGRRGHVRDLVRPQDLLPDVEHDNDLHDRWGGIEDHSIEPPLDHPEPLHERDHEDQLRQDRLAGSLEVHRVVLMSVPLLSEDWKQQLLALETGWDSYKARPITQAAIETLGQFSVVPCSSGGIQFEIHRDGFDIEIEIDPNGKIESAIIGVQR